MRAAPEKVWDAAASGCGKEVQGKGPGQTCRSVSIVLRLHSALTVTGQFTFPPAVYKGFLLPMSSPALIVCLRTISLPHLVESVEGDQGKLCGLA